jgi:hypothetical protein
MRKSLLSVVAGTALLFAACGSDSDGASTDAGTESSSPAADSAPSTDPGSSASGAQGEVADMVIAEAKNEGIDLDADCVNDITAELSDEDAAAIVAAGVGGDPDVSVEGDAAAAKIATCADNEQLVDAFIEELKSSGQTFDEQCVRDGLEGANLAELATSEETGTSAPTDLVEAVFDCFDLTVGS